MFTCVSSLQRTICLPVRSSCCANGCFYMYCLPNGQLVTLFFRFNFKQACEVTDTVNDSKLPDNEMRKKKSISLHLVIHFVNRFTFVFYFNWKRGFLYTDCFFNFLPSTFTRKWPDGRDFSGHCYITGHWLCTWTWHVQAHQGGKKNVTSFPFKHHKLS